MAKFGKSVYGMMRYLERKAPGHYELKWQGSTVEIKKVSGANRSAGHWFVFVDAYPKAKAKTFNEATDWVVKVWGQEKVESRNLLTGEKIMVARADKGGCCDPGTERYWAM